MRDIIFRGKEIASGKWRYGGICKTAEETAIIEHEMANIHDAHLFDFYRYDVDPKTVGQFTGLIDMANKPIYEGDIVEAEINPRPSWNADAYGVTIFPRTKTYWVVEYHDHATESGFMTYGIDRRWHRPLTRSRVINAHAKVVGNIHDNPELMKKETEK